MDPVRYSLAQQAAHYQAWVQQSVDAIVTLDESGCITFWNSAAESIFGYASSEVAGRELLALIIPPDQRNLYGTTMVDSLEKGQGFYLGRVARVILMKKNADCFPAEVSCFQTQLEDVGDFTAVIHPSTPIAHFGVGVDSVMPGVQVEELFQSLVDDTPTAMWMTNLEGLPVYRNRAWREFMGPLAADPYHIDWDALIHPDDIATVKAEYYEALEKRLPYRGEFRMKRYDSEYRWLYCAANPRYANGGVFEGYIGTFMDITKRKQAEQALQESEERFRTLADAVPTPIWIGDTRGNNLYVNQAWLQYTGVEYAQALHSNWKAVVHPDELEEYGNVCEKAWRDGVPFQMEVRIRRATGDYGWLLSSGAPRYTKDGKLVGAVGIGVDITKRKQAEQALQESEERFRLLADATPVMIGVYDDHGDSIYYNQATLDFAGASMEDLQGGRWLNFVHPADREWMTALHYDTIAQHTGYTKEYRVCLSDGTVRHLLRMAKPRFRPDGEYMGQVCVAVDITAQKEALEKFQRISDANIIGIVRWDHNSTILDANDAFLNMIGYTREELQQGSINWKAMSPPEYRSLVESCWEKMAGGGTCLPVEKQLIRKDGERIDVVAGGAGFEDKPEEGMLFVLDITPRRTMERALERTMEGERVRRRILELTVSSADLAYQFGKPVDLNTVAEEVCRFYKADRCVIINYRRAMEHSEERELILSGQACVSADLPPVTIEMAPEYILAHSHFPLDALHQINASNPDELYTALKDKLRRVQASPEEIELLLKDFTRRIEEDYRVRALLRVGITYRGQPYGTISLHQCTRTRHWEEDEILLLEEIAQHIGSAFYQEELQEDEREAHQALEKNNQLLSMVNDAQSYYISKADPETLFKAMLSKLLAYTNSQFGFISEVLYAPDKKPYMKTRFLTNAAWDEGMRRFNAEQRKGVFELHTMETLFGKVVAQGQPMISNEPETDPRRVELPPGHPRLTAFLGLPLYKGDDVVGMIGIANRSGGYPEGIVGELQPYLLSCANIMVGTRHEALRKKLTLDLKISERSLKQYAAQLERSNHELEQFATVASHDLQAPLRKVALFSDFIRETAGENLPLECYDYIERMQKAIAKMQRLITDLLSLSRVTRLGKPFQPVELQEVLRDVLVDLEPRRQQVQGAIEVEGSLTIDADDTQMHQMLQNLIDNALKFHKKDVPPLVRVHIGVKDDQTCEVIISDNGIGFDEQYAERIFGVFERLHGESEYEGTGIGLAIVLRIVERHGGTVIAHSSPGQGSTFIVNLPIHQPLPEDSVKESD